MKKGKPQQSHVTFQALMRFIVRVENSEHSLERLRGMIVELEKSPQSDERRRAFLDAVMHFTC
jgi:hypothetical protein